MNLNEMRKLLEDIFSEGLDGVINGNLDIPEHIIKKYHGMLPKDDKSDNSLKFLLKLHRKGEIRPEMSEIKDHMNIITKFNLKNKLKNINTFDDLKNLTTAHTNATIYDVNGLTVEHHKTHNEAIKAAKLDIDNSNYKYTTLHGKAQWCVSSDNQKGKEDFDFYTENNKNPFYTIKTPDKRKYAFIADKNIKKHGHEGIFQNELNETINPSDFIKKYPEIKNVKEIYPLIRHHDLDTTEGVEHLKDDDLTHLGHRASKYGDMEDISNIKNISKHLSSNKKKSLLDGMSYPHPDPQFLEHLPEIHKLLKVT